MLLENVIVYLCYDHIWIFLSFLRESSENMHDLKNFSRTVLTKAISIDKSK
jgi:hypothetical protein